MRTGEYKQSSPLIHIYTPQTDRPDRTHNLELCLMNITPSSTEYPPRAFSGIAVVARPGSPTKRHLTKQKRCGYAYLLPNLLETVSMITTQLSFRVSTRRAGRQITQHKPQKKTANVKPQTTPPFRSFCSGGRSRNRHVHCRMTKPHS